ncbi:uncharacterized protein N7483_011159 [Penicillium malachiteum]|uniref:uncharacterized protein n=1 Tax=Penicillium malachiteum TaxID=1324776 RepID=UPI00254965B0|nr:uncharacterized protein N7483_011159 [Penicillium malachiteum]KAJ5713978.1 hypothetical protein N7483_011159 [Penicillium malachiteum]
MTVEADTYNIKKVGMGHCESLDMKKPVRIEGSSRVLQSSAPRGVGAHHGSAQEGSFRIERCPDAIAQAY